MSGLHLTLADEKTKYRPGETLEGVAFWELAARPAAIEVHLYWRTQGKGTADLQVVHTERFDGVAAQDRRPFRIPLPPGPYSVSGILVSLVWGVELVTEPKGEAANVEIVISPTGEEIRLQQVEKKK
jgi:hypothetical protein